METECFAQVRGSALRVTGLDRCGDLSPTIPYVVSKSVVKVAIDEVSGGGSSDMLRNAAGVPRLRLVRPEQTLKYTADIEFTRVDPGLLNLVTGVPVVTAERPWVAMGFGEGPFGIGPFGGGYYIPSEGGGEPLTVTAGFDMKSRLRPVAFALEVWTKLSGQGCAGKYGYTVLPFLKGGRLSGFSYTKDGLVSFKVIGASTQRGVRWGSGPFDVDTEPLSEIDWTTGWRNVTVAVPPPAQTDGVVELAPVGSL